MFTRDELSEPAIRAHLETVEVDEKTRMLMLNLVHKISDLEFEKEEAGRTMQALVDAALEAHRLGWEKCREEAVKAITPILCERSRFERISEREAFWWGLGEVSKTIRALEYSNE